MPQSLGQFANKTSTTRIIQSTYNLLDIRTKLRINTFNFFEKLFNFLGEGFGNCSDMTTTPPTIADYITVPIPQPLSNCLGENNVTTSRQNGTHKCAKTAEVEAVGATGLSSGARVACEGGGCGAGGLDVDVSR
ncbi:N-terminal acetyltransferase A, auxiliary subunit [Babesia caballi]|uniref:N-terminal acetyltransferase A, auxiliary subunit n=1 Tax=Babesia caballi TaxID=5871 RepID=A0AAV4LTF7_BABCB|nr:N-terminal acetyltransferase A, auxiliary subunit [Babesia caballi]